MDFERVIDHLPAAVAVAGADGLLLYANGPARELFCIPDLEGRPLTDLPLFVTHADGRPVPPDERPLARALRTGESVDEELDLQRPDGTVVALAVRTEAIRDENGRVQ